MNKINNTYIKEELLQELKNIPKTPTPQKDKTLTDDTKILYREERKKLLKTCK